VRQGRSRSLAVIGLAVVLLIPPISLPPRVTAAPFEETFFTMISHRSTRRDFLGRGESRFFHPGNAVSWGHVGEGSESLGVTVRGGPRGTPMFPEEWRFYFYPPEGKKLEVGLYTNTRTWPDRQPDDPGMEIDGDGRGCRGNTGRFEIKDLASSADGTLTRLWLIYEHRCESWMPPMVGEIRVGMPGEGGALSIGNRALRLSDEGVGGGHPVVPIYAVNTSESPVTVSSVALDGDSDYRIRLDECSHRVLVSNESCAVWVRFVPTVEGLHTAAVRITEADGFTHEATLESETSGTGIPRIAGVPGSDTGGGPTKFSYNSEPGDYVGQGKQGSFDHSNAMFEVYGDHNGVEAYFWTPDDRWSSIILLPPGGDILAPGLHFPEAERARFTTHPGLDVSVENRGCNQLTGSFTIHKIRVSEFDRLLEFSASFEQHCEGGPSALFGRFDWREERPQPDIPPYPQPGSDPDPGDDPGTDRFERSISLASKDGQAKGRVSMEEPVRRCRAGVVVKVQRKIDGRYQTVTQGSTTRRGRYRLRLGKRHGVFRAVAPRIVLSGKVCARTASRKMRF
jgi:hypothetical protein